MNRRTAREYAFELIFESFFDDNYNPNIQMELAFLNRGIEIDDYIKTVVIGVYNNHETIDSLISENSNTWKINRMSKVSLSIMELAVFEMLYISDIPYNVSINEAVELCKKFDDDNSHKFVNGILNSIAEKKGYKQ